MLPGIGWWDLTPLMRGLHNHLPAPGFGDDYYDILIEFAKLPRFSHPWVEDPEIQRRLDRSFPFRPVRQSVEHSYRFVDG